MKGLYPSSAHRWVNCTNSLRESEPFRGEQEQSEAALEGTAAHWVAHQLFLGNKISVGDHAPNDVAVDEEMLEAAQEFVALLPFDAVMEQKIDLSGIYQGMSGQPDASHHSIDGTELTIWDFKYGHRGVDEFENWQMLVEAVGLYRPTTRTIRMFVVQPRCYQRRPVRHWEITIERLVVEYLSRIVAGALASVEGGAYTVGPWCGGCPGRRTCPALAEMSYAVIDETKLPAPTELPLEKLSRELLAIYAAESKLEARKTGLEEQVEHAIRIGEQVKGFMLEQAYGRNTWKIPAEQVFALGRLFGVNLKKDPAPITPAQAKKAGVDPTSVEAVSHNPPKAMKLKVDNGKLARKVFGK
jgi:hypothetical protein